MASDEEKWRVKWWSNEAVCKEPGPFSHPLVLSVSLTTHQGRKWLLCPIRSVFQAKRRKGAKAKSLAEASPFYWRRKPFLEIPAYVHWSALAAEAKSRSFVHVQNNLHSLLSYLPDKVQVASSLAWMALVIQSHLLNLSLCSLWPNLTLPYPVCSGFQALQAES